MHDATWGRVRCHDGSSLPTKKTAEQGEADLGRTGPEEFHGSLRSPRSCLDRRPEAAGYLARPCETRPIKVLDPVEESLRRDNCALEELFDISENLQSFNLRNSYCEASLRICTIYVVSGGVTPY